VGAQAITAPTAVVVAVQREEGDEATVTVGALLLVGLVLAETVVYDVVVFVDAALHVGFAAAGEERQSSRCEQGCSYLRRAFHGGVFLQGQSIRNGSKCLVTEARCACGALFGLSNRGSVDI
jgi:hypothetical protein